MFHLQGKRGYPGPSGQPGPDGRRVCMCNEDGPYEVLLVLSEIRLVP